MIHRRASVDESLQGLLYFVGSEKSILEIMKNQLFFGDCLEILEKYLVPQNPDGFIDLVYIDPPFNSKRDYNVLFESADLSDSTAQKQAFADTWSNISYMDELDRIQDLNLDLYHFLKTLEKVKTPRSAVAYLTTMALRIIYIHKVLKSTGSFYLHCDQTMSHYLKILCDMVFGHGNYRNEIIWKRTNNPKGSQFRSKKFGVYTDTILFYTKSNNYFFELDAAKSKLSAAQIEKKYPYTDERGRYYQGPIFCSRSMGPRPNLCYEYKGVYPPHPSGWRLSKDRLIELDKAGNLGWSKNGSPFRKLRPEDDKGDPISSLWDDIFRLYNSHESLGYPTQKPEALMERIIKASSKEGDLVADFFCGCGTTIAAAQRLGRKWLGVDISHLAVKLIMDRLLKPWEDNLPKQKEIRHSIEVTGIPRDIDSAKELARNTARGRFTFQDWIIEFMLGGVSNQKKSGDGGYDGYITFRGLGGHKGVILIEVKSGNVGVKNIREFIQVVEKQRADMGVFVCFRDQYSSGMASEARQAGYYQQDVYKDKYQKIRVMTVEDILDGHELTYPKMLVTTFKSATDKLIKPYEHGNLFE